jgi:hypothetical protein
MPKIITARWKSIAAAGLTCLVLSGLGISVLIGHQVREVVAAARATEAGDAVSALIAVVNSPDRPLAERNKAVWALGQLGSSRALPTLEALYSGVECDHSAGLCQHRLEKAIHLCRGEKNVGALVWRHGALAVR